MKANELMIGDWVYYKGKEQMPCRVTSIIGNSIKFDNGTPQDWMSDVSNFTPIPLTDEILVKNGFRKDQMYFYLNVDDDKLLEFYAHEKRLRLWWDGIDEWAKATVHDLLFQCQCKYVHQLQQVLRLCRIEKEIEL